MKKFCYFLSVIVFIFTLYSLRQIFYYRYEPAYYENWFYTSQWNIPGSTRGIADGELYKFVGYRLTQGENPFNINFEVPPLGKYLYGLAETSIGNPYWVSLFFLSGLSFRFCLVFTGFRSRPCSRPNISTIVCLYSLFGPLKSAKPCLIYR